MTSPLLVVGGISLAHKVAAELEIPMVHVRTHAHHTALPDEAYEATVDVGPRMDQPLNTLADEIASRSEVSGCQRILCLHDESVVFGALLAERLCLSFHPVDSVVATVDKTVMRRTLEAAGLNSVAFGQVRHQRPVWESGSPLGPIVLKPVDGRGSRGVEFFPNEEALRRVLSDGPEREGFIIEEMKVGREFSVESIMSPAGSWHGVTSKETRGAVESGHVHPAPLSPGLERLIRETVVRCLRGLGLERGLFHTEVILDHEGAHIVETHTRGGGDGILDLVRLATGLDLTDLYVRDVTLGLDRLPFPGDGRWASSQFGFANQDGILRGWAMSSTFGPDVVDVQRLKKAGDLLVADPASSNDRVAMAIAVGHDADSARAQALDAVNHQVPEVGSSWR